MPVPGMSGHGSELPGGVERGPDVLVSSDGSTERRAGKVSGGTANPLFLRLRLTGP